MKFLALIPALLISATPINASTDVTVTVDRDEAFAIRSCAEEFGGPFTAVCYNQINTLTVGPFSRSKERVVRVPCDRRFPRTDRSTRGVIASNYCPQVTAGTLPPAPFLQ